MGPKLNDITEPAIGAAITVHKALEPGCWNRPMRLVFPTNLTQNGLNFERQKGLPLNYRGVHLDCGYRIDLLVETQVVVDLFKQFSLF